MKKSLGLVVIVFLVITNLIFISTTVLYKTKIDKQVYKVYSFEGEDADVRICNGFIIISLNKQTVNGGKIQYIGKELENIKIYSETVFFIKEGDKNIVLSNSVSIRDDTKGISFPGEFLLNSDIGEISSNKLFSEDDMNIIKDNLYFAIDYSTIDGKTGSFTIKLKVKEICMNENKE